MWAATGFASGLPVVPVNVQLAIFQNVWKLDRNFRQPVKMAILYQENYRSSIDVKNEVVSEIGTSEARIECAALEVGTPELLTQALNTTDANVIYVAPLRAVDVAAIARISRQRHIRTITGVPEYVESGIGVGIGLRKNRPLIIINLAGARAEGADFTAQLLGLSRIVGPLQ
jgi:hypothetical protein